MDNVLIVVDGETDVEGASVDRLIGLQNVRATLATMRTPDGHGRIELDKFHTPEAIGAGRARERSGEPLGMRRIIFAVDDLDAVRGAVELYRPEARSGGCAAMKEVV